MIDSSTVHQALTAEQTLTRAAAFIRICRKMQTPFPLHWQRFPWRDGNRFTLLADGEIFFPAMLADIAAARHFVLLEMYLLASGRVADSFISAFEAAIARGVDVFVLADDFGARGLNQVDRNRLHQAGAHLAFYNPLHYGKWRRNFWRDHRKLLVVDGEIAYTGGTGITDDFVPRPPYSSTFPLLAATPPWHDVMLRVQGPCVADWQNAFAQVWKHTRDGRHSPQSPPVQPGLRQGRVFGRQGAKAAATGRAATHKCCTAGEQQPGLGRVVLNNPVRMEIKRSLLNRLRNSQRRAWIATAYFIPSWKLRRALYQAARRGCDVRLLLPGPHTDHPSVRHVGRRYYHKLLAAGVRIFEYQPRFLHAKTLLIDNWVSIGSSNIDRWNFRWSLEANQEASDPALKDQLAGLFEQNFAASREILADQWHHRPWYQRLPERFWGTLELWLERFNQRQP
ncbi:phospholipase D-like domain-containing protein [Desulfurivibrio alkaliphilus]|nr:phospholipase D-like domain-containing protein [Desulfurivibrio alkaliphilus]